MTDDQQLLRAYAQDQSQPAFAELVSRHAGMVYAAAMRETRDQQLAQDVVQATFLLLARKRPADRSVAGWLFLTARNLGRDAARQERRRRNREREAAMHRPETAADVSADLQEILPVLNDSIAELSAGDREAVVLRFFQDRSHAEIGRALNVSEDAAKMRVSRAVARLRTALAGRGAVVSAIALPVVLAATVTPAPAAAMVTGPASAGANHLVNNALRKAILMKCTFAMAMATIVLLASAAVYAVWPPVPVQKPVAVPPVPVARPAAGTWAVARFSAFVEAQAVADLQKDAVRVVNDAKQYQCFTLPSDAFTGRIAGWLDTPKLRMLSPYIAWQIDGKSDLEKYLHRDAGLTVIGGSLYSISVSGTSDVLFEQTRSGGTRFTLDCHLMASSQIVKLDDQIRRQTPAKSGETFFAVAPAMKDGTEQLYHVMAWQILGPESPADRVKGTAAWLGQTKPMEPQAFQPVTAAFENSEIRGTVQSVALPSRESGDRGHDNGMQKYRVTVRLRGLYDNRGEYMASFIDWDPPTQGAVGDIDQRRGECAIVTFLPWHRRTATLSLGVPGAPWREIATFTPADAGKTAKIAGTDSSVTFDNIVPDGDGRCTINATTRNASRLLNVCFEAYGDDGKQLRSTGLRWGGGQDRQELKWIYTVEAPATRVKTIRLVTQPIVWAKFPNIALPIADDDAPEPRALIAADLPANPAQPATKPATRPAGADSPEAAQQAIQQALNKGDLAAVMALTYTETPLQRRIAEVMGGAAVAQAKLYRAAVAAYGAKDVEREDLAHKPGDGPAMKFKVDGDVATAIPDEHVKYVGAEPRFRKVNGQWKADMTAMDLSKTDPKELETMLAEGEREIKRVEAFTAQIVAGKYETASDATKAMREGR